jgi:1-aminocyclopropane-1-carboxylate deaminase
MASGLESLNWAPCAPLQRLRLDWLEDAGVEVAVLRLDLIDPLISGNKWFKLAPHLGAARAIGKLGLMSLGGAHSNHLHALAAAGRRFGFPTVGLLRGQFQDTPTVQDLRAFGMELHWLGYGGYRERHRPDFWAPWIERHPALYPVAEGGGGLDGAQGCAALVAMAREQMGALGWPDYHGWWLGVGTGTTLAGLILGEGGQRPVYGALAVPEDHGVEKHVCSILQQAGIPGGYSLIPASRGGFGKLDAQLAQFIHDAQKQSEVPLEPLYTGKALLALWLAVRSGRFARGTRLVFLHTGGLQGRRAMAARLRELGSEERADQVPDADRCA